MSCHCPRAQDSYDLLVDGASMNFSSTTNDHKASTCTLSYTVWVLREQLGDYGHFTDSGDFCFEGNLFTDFKANITPRKHKISLWDGHQGESSIVTVDHCGRLNPPIELYKPLGLSLPTNDDFKSLLVSLSTQLTNRYLVTQVIKCTHNSSMTTCLYNIAKAFVWHRHEGAGFVVGKAGTSGKTISAIDAIDWILVLFMWLL